MGKNPEPGSEIRVEHPDLVFEDLVSAFWVKNTKKILGVSGSGIISTLVQMQIHSYAEQV
jgi:hypothetical protein